LDAFAKLNGIQQYEAINVGFAIVQSLAAGKVDAVMGPLKPMKPSSWPKKAMRSGISSWKSGEYRITMS
jgi:putative hydroxymethylpyrimidine transport system substrate-binding protein